MKDHGGLLRTGMRNIRGRSHYVERAWVEPMRRRAPHAGATLPAARWLGPLLTAAVLLAAAPDPAAAQSYSGSPKLYRSSLNGATITLTGIYFGDGVAGQLSRYGILDWPGSGSLSIQSVSTNQGAGTVTLTLAYTGTFVTDQSIRISLNELVTSGGSLNARVHPGVRVRPGPGGGGRGEARGGIRHHGDVHREAADPALGSRDRRGCQPGYE